MKSKYIGKIVNDCEIIDSEYKLSKAKRSGATYYKLKCLKCGEILERPATSILKNYVKCKCKCRCKHTYPKDRIASIYRNMIDRCYNSKNKSYKNYGGKGIIICDEWLQNFDNFKNWALTNGYEEALTIDRINNNGNYEPSNCRWVTKSFNSGYTSRWGKDKDENYTPENKKEVS